MLLMGQAMRVPKKTPEIHVMTFKLIDGTFEEIAEASSTKEKIHIIHTTSITALGEFFKEVVYRALNPYLTYKMTGTIPEPKKVPALSEPMTDLTAAVFKRLSYFTTKSALTDQEKADFTELVQLGGTHLVKIVNRILNKDLRCGASILTFRKAHQDFEILPVHHPMKGIDDFDKFYRQSGGRSNICWSCKLDGTRTWAIVNVKSASVTYLSSNGIELPNFHCFDEQLLQAANNVYEIYKWSSVIFDGEVINVQGDFSKHMSQFRRLNELDPSGFRFRIFDFPLYIRPDPRPFHERYSSLQNSGLPIWKFDQSDDSLCSIVHHGPLLQSPKSLMKKMIDLGFEGLMLKTWSGLYQEKRSNDWCKIKAVYTEDLPVVDVIEGTGKYLGMLGALVVKRGNVKVEVGSGFSDAERHEFWLNPPNCIEVKYQEALSSGSLRFPIFVRVREDKGDIR